MLVTGYGNASNGIADFATVAYDATTGAQRWVRRYNGPGNGDDEAWALGVNSHGEVFVTGQSAGRSSNWDYATIAYRTATGKSLWLRRYNGPGNFFDQPFSLGVTPDGGTVLVTGLSAGARSGEDYATIAYRGSTGTHLWLRRFNSPANADDEANALAVSPDGTKVFVTGTSFSPLTNWDYITVAYGV